MFEATVHTPHTRVMFEVESIVPPTAGFTYWTLTFPIDEAGKYKTLFLRVDEVTRMMLSGEELNTDPSPEGSEVLGQQSEEV